MYDDSELNVFTVLFVFVCLFVCLLFYRWLCEYLPEEKQSQLQGLLTSSDPIEIESAEYNWLLNKL